VKTVFPIPNIYHSFQEKDAFFSPPAFSPGAEAITAHKSSIMIKKHVFHKKYRGKCMQKVYFFANIEYNSNR
jgi:hypothetical protein